MKSNPALLLYVLLGLAIGVGAYTFIYAKGGSYLTNDPAACANCHIMNTHYSAWMKSSHHTVAVCNDCHTPPGFVAKYMVKAENGFRHSLAFTTGRFPEPLRITEGNHRVTEKACRKCHTPIVTAIETSAHGETLRQEDQLSCIQCHRTVGHWVR